MKMEYNSNTVGSEYSKRKLRKEKTTVTMANLIPDDRQQEENNLVMGALCSQ